MNNISVGVDIVEINRFIKFNPKTRFAENIFTEKEIKDCLSKQNPAQSLAGRFAAKEALIKSVDQKIPFNKIEIVNNSNGTPQAVVLDKKINKNYYFSLSISHTSTLAEAVCISIKK